MRTVILSLLALMAVPARAQRVEVPIRPVVLSDGVRRYAITVVVDGKPVEVGLDTGSTGLRLLSAAMPDAAARRGEGVRYRYGSGIEFVGTAVPVALSVGTLSKDAVRVQRIDMRSCLPHAQDCAPDKIARADFGIQGDGLPGEGFAGIMGIGLRADPVGNPLEALGARRWIVDLPRAGEARGRLVLNPSDDEVARYHQFAFITDTNQVAGCIVAADGSARLCAPTMVDTGASGLRVQGGTAKQLLPQGTPALLVLGDGKATASMPVTIGRRDQASGMRLYPARQPGELSLSFGIAPYLHWSIFYDAGARRIGVAEREGAE